MRLYQILKKLSILSVLVLAGCSSVPLGSMVKMASMNEKDIRILNPKEIKTRITLDSPVELKKREVRLALRFEFGGSEESEYQFQLKFLSEQKVNQTTGWFGKAIQRSQYEFELAEESIAEFRKYQREFTRFGKPDKYYWTVYYFLEPLKSVPEKALLDLEIKLAASEDYFYLLKDAEVEIDAG